MPKKPEEMSAEELREEALKWASGEGQQPVEEETPRDEQGRFVARDEKEVTPVEPEEEVVYEKVIDLGDGSGVQVFQGKTMEELVEKLAQAQTNATRKIREQAAAIKTQPKPVVNPAIEKELTPEQKFILAQEMANDPVKTINRFVSESIERREREQREAAEREKAQSEAFVANTPEYYASPKNGERMTRYLTTYQLEASEENLKKAFDDLSASGLLEARPAEVKETPVAPKEGEEEPARIEQKPVSQTVVRRRVVGGVSVKRSAPAPAPTTELTEEQLYKLPMHELEEVTRRRLMQ